MKAIYYVRVSTDIQDNKRQIADIEKYCGDEKIEIVKGFEETESGKIKIRPILTELDNYVEENYKSFDYLIISELSRLGRTSKVLETIENLNQKKIGLISLKEKILTLNPDKSVNHSSSLILSILSSINGYELETFKYRSKSGIEKSIKSGNAGGSSNYPFGYTKDENKKLVINEEEANIIKEIYDLYLSGKGTKTIANILNEKRIITRTQQLVKDGLNKKKYNFGKGWVDGTIYYILKNPLYTGQRRRKIKEITIEGQKTKKVEYELLNQPQLKIIEPEIFSKVLKLLKSNYNKSDKHNKYEYLLEPQKILCGCCLTNRNVIRHYYPHKRETEKAIAKRKNDNRYICLSRRYAEPCHNVGINIDKLEYVIQQIILFLFEDDLISRLDDKLMKKQIEDLEQEIILLNKDLEKLIRKEGELIELKLEGDISKEIFDIKHKDIKSKQNQILNQVNLKNENKIGLKTTYENMKDIKQLKINFSKGNKIPKDIVNKIITKIKLTKKELNEIQYPNLFKNKQDKVIELEILSGGKEYLFLISHRESIIFYCNHGDDGFTMNKFLINKNKDGDKFIEHEQNYNKELFKFLTAEI